jgi:hypothetical protein
MCYLNDPIKFFAFSNIKKVQYDLIFIVVFFYLNFQFPKIIQETFFFNSISILL